MGKPSALEVAIQQENERLQLGQHDRSQERLRADDELRQKFRGQYVAFLEWWEGDRLLRDVKAVAPTRTELRDTLRETVGNLLDSDPLLRVLFFSENDVISK